MAATLQDIRVKVRRLTRSPSNNELTDAQIDDYVNTFILYDFPEHLRLFDFHTTFRFVCNPNQDVYVTGNDTNIIPATDPLFDFKNLYISVNPPVFIDGYRAYYSQSQQDFYSQYPDVDFVQDLGFGNGSPGPYTFQLTSFPIAQNSVMLSGITSSNTSSTLQDYPTIGENEFGTLRAPGDNLDRGLINYLTGEITLATFQDTIGTTEKINAHYYSYVAARPLALYYMTQTLRYSNTVGADALMLTSPTFVLRPIPDKAYTIEFQVFKRPSALLSSGAQPELEQYWQYIAYGAAKKVFEDRMDLDSAQMILPEYKKQEQLTLRRTIVQQTNQRTATIYTQQTDLSSVWPGWGWNQQG